MDQERQIQFLKRQITALEREKAAALEALDLASSMGTFETSYTQMNDSGPILSEICRRAGEMIRLKTSAIYLIDENTQDLIAPHHVDSPLGKQLDEELDALIADQSFHFALQSERPCFFLTSEKNSQLLLHVLNTPTRIRGMFVALLDQDKNEILDTTLSLFTLVMQAGAHALESFDLGRQFREHRQELDRLVKKRTQQLVEVNDQLETILENMPAGVIVIDEKTRRIRDVNTAALNMLDQKRENVVDRICHQFICPNYEGNCPVLDKNKQVLNMEQALLRESGSELTILKTVARVTIDGKPHLIETFVDISEQKKLDRLREDMDRIMRHDLKTPLNGIINVPDILLNTMTLDSEERELLKEVRAAGRKMLQMINISLDLFKMETCTYEYHPDYIELTGILFSVVRDLDSWLHAKKLDIQLLLNGGPLALGELFPIQGEELLCYSLFANLLKNAVEAAPERSVVTVDLKTGDQVEIAIHNFGTVPESIRESFFEKYTTAGKRHGTGLGTYSARLMTRTMGGDIAMTTSEDTGTTITVTLPA